MGWTEVQKVTDKPHKGRIDRWTKLTFPLGTIVFGRALEHPAFAGSEIRTSYVVSHDEATGEIETRNSRYTLVGKELK